MRRHGPAISGLAYLIVCVCRSSWRTAVEKTNTSVLLAAAASSWPRCCVRFSKWASSVSLHERTLPPRSSVLLPHHTSLYLQYLQNELNSEDRRNNNNKKTLKDCLSDRDAYTSAHTNTNIHRHIKCTCSLLVKMKAAIMLGNCAGGTSLFSDAPRPHWNPFSLIYRLWEAQCAEKEMLCTRPLQFDVPFSFVFTYLNGQVGLGFAPVWPLLLPVGRETAF